MSSLKELQDLIQEKYGIGPGELDPTASMRDKGFDSLALAEFLFEIEDRLKISLPDPDPEMDTLGQLAALVDQVRSAPAPKQQQAA
jgi:acyl carrier protein